MKLLVTGGAGFIGSAFVRLALSGTDSISLGNLDAYIRSVQAIPMLEAAEEQALARQLREQNDLQAASRLVMSHLRFVVHIARSYSGYGLPLGDLVQEGNVGLMKAVKGFGAAAA